MSQNDKRILEVLAALLVDRTEEELRSPLGDVDSDVISWALHRLEDAGYHDQAEALKGVIYHRTANS